ncbi:hypothetical protein Dimus_015974, partial [Dionaea muscipula]
IQYPFLADFALESPTINKQGNPSRRFCSGIADGQQAPSTVGKQSPTVNRPLNSAIGSTSTSENSDCPAFEVWLE